VEVDIINLFSFTLKDRISKWGENYVEDHPNCTFEEFERAFCKWFKIVKNEEEAYMQLQNIQQQTTEHVEVYYEHLLKLTNCLQVKTTYVFLIIVFRASLLPYLRLATTSMKKYTLIEHKEAIVVCEESGLVNLNYNVLLTTLKANIVVKPIVLVVTTKSILIYTNCGKIGHSLKICHNRKIKVPIVPTTTIKSIESIVETKTQLVKLGRILVRYLCIICSNAKHISGECPKKIVVQN